MIAYVMVGTNDLESAVKFYDRLMPKMNMVRVETDKDFACLLYTSPSPRDATLSRMPSSA